MFVELCKYSRYIVSSNHVCVCVCVYIYIYTHTHTHTHTHIYTQTHTHTHILMINTIRCIYLSNLFRNETLHDSDNSFAHHQEFFTANIAMVYVIQVCRKLSRRIRMELVKKPVPSWSCPKAVYKPVWHIPLLYV